MVTIQNGAGDCSSLSQHVTDTHSWQTPEYLPDTCSTNNSYIAAWSTKEACHFVLLSTGQIMQAGVSCCFFWSVGLCGHIFQICLYGQISTVLEICHVVLPVSTTNQLYWTDSTLSSTSTRLEDHTSSVGPWPSEWAHLNLVPQLGP